MAKKELDELAYSDYALNGGEKMTRLLYIGLASFLFFVPLGSAPIYVGTYKIDNVIGFFLAFLLIAYLLLTPRGRGARVSVILTAAAFSYFLALLVSTFVAPDIIYSLGRFSIISGYAFVAILVPALFAWRAPQISRLVLVYAVISSTVIWMSFLVLGMSSWGRMTIPTWYNGMFTYFPEGWGSSADPNMLGFGLILCLVFGLLFMRISSLKSLLLIGFCISAAALTMSRTAFLSLLVALMLAGIVVALPEMGKGKYLRIRKESVLKLSSALALGVGCAYFFSPFQALFQRFLLDNNSGRIERIVHVLGNWAENGNSILVGVGFDNARTSIDPHNIYLTALHDSGLVGLTMLLVFLFTVFVYSLNITIFRLRFFANFIFFYITIGGLTYWHTKTFWVSIMFVLFIVYYDRVIRKEHWQPLARLPSFGQERQGVYGAKDVEG